MKKELLFSMVIAGVFLMSCTGSNSSKQQNPDNSDKTAVIFDNLVQSAVKDSTGSTLEMSFDDEDNTAFFVFNGEIIELKGDTMASGIKYSNAQYEFTEWHGEITLKKDGEVVFNYKE